MKACLLLVFLLCFIPVTVNLSAIQAPRDIHNAEGARLYNWWLGTTSRDWHTPSNWGQNTVPTSTHDVFIGDIPAAQCPIVSSAAYCHSLEMASPLSSLTIGASYLSVMTDYESFGALVINDPVGTLWVEGDLYFKSGASINIDVMADIMVQGNVEFQAGSNVHASVGTFTLYGTGDSYFLTHAPTAIGPFSSWKDSPFVSGISALSTSTLTISGLIQVYGGSTFTHPYAGTTILKSSIYAPTTGICYFGAGTISMEGSQDSYLDLNNTSSYFNHLTINKSPANSVTAETGLRVRGKLTATSGTFDVNSQTIIIEDGLDIWAKLKMNTATGFVDVWDDVNWFAGSVSEVTAGNIHCRWDWYFHAGCSVDLTGCTVRMDSDYGAAINNFSPIAQFGTLEIYAVEESPETIYNHPNGDPLRVNGNLLIYPTNTLNLIEGNCEVAGLVYINPTGGIIVGDGGTITINGNLELHGSLDVGPGTAVVHGEFFSYGTGILDVEWGIFKNDSPLGSGGSNVVYLNCSVNLYHCLFEVTHKKLVVNLLPSGVFTNAQIRVGLGFSATATNCYQPNGGGLYLIGDTSANIDVTSGNYLASLHINKDSNSQLVILGADLSVQGSTNINTGTLVLSDNILGCFGNLTVNGILDMSAGSTVQMFSPGYVIVNSGGLLRAIGTPEWPATFTHGTSTYYYGFSVYSGATISATWAVFQFMNANGVNVGDGAIVDPANSFNYCVFRQGAAGGRMITISNSQDLTVQTAGFTSSYGTYNVTKLLDQGSITFQSYYGDFGGPALEQDPYNRVHWGNMGLPPVTNLNIALDPTWNGIALTWGYSLPGVQFNIYRSTDPAGPWGEPHGTSSSQYWSEALNGANYFYRVTAFQP